MPTVLRQDGFDVMIYTDDHPPAHVHVRKAGGEVVINLGDDETPPSIREVHGMKKQDTRKAVIIVEDNQVYLLSMWGEIHG
jgi:hypothetical protein